MYLAGVSVRRVEDITEVQDIIGTSALLEWKEMTYPPGTANSWRPGINDRDGTLVLFGGELYADHQLLARVTTPPALELSSPNFMATGVVINAADGLALSWNASEADTRIIIHVIDSVGAVLSAHAADDGAYTISGGDLSMLFPGTIDVIVAREREDRMLFSEGGITVKTRHEQWGFFELQ